MAGDQFSQSDYIEPSRDNSEGVNPGEYWKPGSKIEATRQVEINDGVTIGTSQQAGFSEVSARYLPLYDAGSSNYYSQRAISSDASGYGAAVNGFKTLIASADNPAAGRVPIPRFTQDYEPLSYKHQLNPTASFHYTPFKVTT